MSAERPRSDAYAALAVLALVWGYTWVVIKVATHDASALVVAAARPALGAVCLFAVLLLMRRSLRPTPLRDTLVLGLLQTTGFTLLQTLAVSLAGAGKVAVLAYTMPFWVALLAWPFLGERIEGGAGWRSAWPPSAWASCSRRSTGTRCWPTGWAWRAASRGPPAPCGPSACALATTSNCSR